MKGKWRERALGVCLSVSPRSGVCVCLHGVECLHGVRVSAKPPWKRAVVGSGPRGTGGGQKEAEPRPRTPVGRFRNGT